MIYLTLEPERRLQFAFIAIFDCFQNLAISAFNSDIYFKLKCKCKCTGVLLRTKPVLQNYLYFFKTFKKSTVDKV